MRRARAAPAVTLALGAALAAALAGCSGSGSSSPAKSTQGGPNFTSSALSGSVTVLAASSLTESFNDIGRRFQVLHPQASVSFSFGASSTLVQQVNAGAPADVLATADGLTMRGAVKAGSVSDPTVFAHNRLTIVVGKGNPKGVRALADLARPGMIVVLCALEVPCGSFASEVLDKAAVKVSPRSLEANVKAVVSKVTLGEADAGIVYTTDVQAAGASVEGVAIPDDQNVVAAYPIAPVKRAPDPTLARAFVDFVLGPDGQDALRSAGFAQ